MPTDWVEPEEFMRYRNVPVYHTYGNDNIQDGVREFWYTTQSSSCDGDGLSDGVFDVRDLPDPYEGFLLEETNEHKRTIAWAIESGWFEERGVPLEQATALLPTEQENPQGLHQRYCVTKADGSPTDPNAVYFVLRLDDGCEDKEHLKACRAAAKTYAAYVQASRPPLPKISEELRQFLSQFEPSYEFMESMTEEELTKSYAKIPAAKLDPVTDEPVKEKLYEHVWVDVPDKEEIRPDGSWTNVADFHTVREALEFIRENIGPCDEEGRVSLLTYGREIIEEDTNEA